MTPWRQARRDESQNPSSRCGSAPPHARAALFPRPESARTSGCCLQPLFSAWRQLLHNYVHIQIVHPKQTDGSQLLCALCCIVLTGRGANDRKSTRLNSSHLVISYAVFCL